MGVQRSSKPAFHVKLLGKPYKEKVIVTTRHHVTDEEERKSRTDDPEWFADPPVRNLFRAVKLGAMLTSVADPTYRNSSPNIYTASWTRASK